MKRLPRVTFEIKSNSVPFDINTYLSLLSSFQMHPLGLCNNNDEEDLYEYGWVGVVKLEQPELDPSCLTVLGKVNNRLLTLSSFCVVPVYQLLHFPLMYRNVSSENYTVQIEQQLKLLQKHAPHSRLITLLDYFQPIFTSWDVNTLKE